MSAIYPGCLNDLGIQIDRCQAGTAIGLSFLHPKFQEETSSLVNAKNLHDQRRVNQSMRRSPREEPAFSFFASKGSGMVFEESIDLFPLVITKEYA